MELLNPTGLIYAAAGLLLLAIVSGGGAKLPARFLSHLWLRFRSPHGRADWAGWWPILQTGMLKRSGLFLGRRERWHSGADLYRPGEGHLLTVAGSRAGKTTGLVIPALCELKHGAVIVTDPKAQLAAMTHRHRATVGPVIFINPWSADLARAGIDLPDTGFNPLSILEDNYNLKDDAEGLARLLLVTDRQDSKSYWNTEAEALIAAFLVWIVKNETPKNRTLTTLWEMVREGAVEQFDEYGELILDVNGRPVLIDNMKRRLNWFITDSRSKYLKKEGEKYYNLYMTAPQQWQGVISKAQAATSRYAPETPLGDHTAKDGFDLRRLKREDVTVYLMVPTGRTKIASPWLNMLMGVFGLAVGKPGPSRPVYMLMDEAPALGFLPDLRNHLRESGEAGLRTWIFSQTKHALSDPDLYGQTGFNDIMALCETKVFFGIDDLEIAQSMSAMLGEKTSLQRSEGDTGRGNVNTIGVPLMRPEEIIRMKNGRAIIVRARMRPIQAQLVPYWTRPEWASITDKNPYRS